MLNGSDRQANNGGFVRLAALLLVLLPGIFCMGQKAPSSQFVVVIDPGHGGHDPGTTNGSIFEKDIVLSVGLKLGRLIGQELPGVKVVYTRRTDVFIPLHQRAAMANKAEADLFISIHADGVKDHSVSGSSVFVMGLHVNDENLEVAKRENAVITQETDYLVSYDAFDNSTESYIKFSLMQNLYIDQSIQFAGKIQSYFKERVRLKDRGVKQAGFLVLYRTAMPSVLIETGFVTNPEESKFLVSEEGQTFIVEAIFSALKEYKASVDKATLSLQDMTGSGDSGTKDSVKPADRPDGPGDQHGTSGGGSKPGKGREPLPSGIVFAVQICSSPVPINLRESPYRKLQGVSERFLDGAYKYFAGEYKEYEAAETQLAKVKKSVRDAFIVAFRDGKKITVRQARNELKR